MISVDHTGAGALIYYMGYSAPDTAALVMRLLSPGETFIDVGAHIGEYTLLAAHSVGDEGRVHAFEPNAGLLPRLEGNVRRYSLDHVVLNASAVGEQPGEVEFEIRAEPALSSIHMSRKPAHSVAIERTVRVPQVSLDAYCADRGLRPNVVKIDVEGGEWPVFRGAAGLLDRGDTFWIFEFAPHNFARFGYTAADLIDFLHRHDHAVFRYDRGRLAPFDLNHSDTETVDLVAARQERALFARLERLR